MTTTITSPCPTIAFIGGGNMASAIMGGLLAQGHPASQLIVIEPQEEVRIALHQRLGVAAQEQPNPSLAHAQCVVWAVKPQIFKQAAQTTAPHTATQALHMSVAAGIGTNSLARWLGSKRIVRAMPNTPALVGKGITGLFACPEVEADSRALVELAERVTAATGQYLWVEQEALLDAVTALSGSGPAYAFLFLEAMIAAGTGMGLSPAQARQLALATFQGATELAARSDDAPAVLRQRVTSQGGTTHAAIAHMQAQQVPEHFIAAMHRAQERAKEMATEFGD